MQCNIFFFFHLHYFNVSTYFSAIHSAKFLAVHGRFMEIRRVFIDITIKNLQFICDYYTMQCSWYEMYAVCVFYQWAQFFWNVRNVLELAAIVDSKRSRQDEWEAITMIIGFRFRFHRENRLAKNKTKLISNRNAHAKASKPSIKLIHSEKNYHQKWN